MSTPRFSADEHVADLRALLLASQRFRQAIADRFDLGTREVVVLGYLAVADGGLTPSHLAQRMLVGSGTLTAVLDRLVASGYAHRLPNPRDRRSSLVQLTRSGQRLVTTINKQLESVLAVAEAGTNGEARAHLARLAGALDDLADQHAGSTRS